MLEHLLAFVERSGWPDLRILPFFSMVDRRKSLHEEIIADTRERIPRVLATEVPYRSEIERMAVRRAPLPAFAPRSPAGLVYADLWAEVAARMRAG
jgi:chromosome partitioning protein